MYKKLSLSIAGAVGLLLSSSASAQANSSPVEAVGNGWFVWATWGAMGINNCHISKSAENGTKLEFMYSLTNRKGMMKLTNEDWRSLGNGEIHRVSAGFFPDDVQISMDMEAMNATALFRCLMHQFPGTAFVQFMKIAESQNTVTFKRVRDEGEVELASFNLTGMPDAVTSLNNCVGIRAEEEQASKDADPFSD